MGAFAYGAAAVAPFLGGLIGNIASASDRDKAYAAAQAAYQEIQNTGTPPDLAAPIILKQFQQAGILTPQMEHAINLGTSQLSQVQSDQHSKDAQVSALNQLAQRSQSGLNATDRARMNTLLQQSNSQAHAAQNDIIQNMQQRGLATRGGSSGAELALRQAAAQGGSNLAANNANIIASDANQNALASLSQYGQLANQVNAQDFSQDSTKAQAADAFQQFNVQNQQNVAHSNVANQNAAMQYNLNNQQNLSNQNTQQANQELYRQRQAQADTYQLQMQRAQALANAKLGQAGVSMQQANQTAGLAAGVGAGVGAGAAAYGQYQNNQQNYNLAKQTFVAKYGYDPESQGG